MNVVYTCIYMCIVSLSSLCLFFVCDCFVICFSVSVCVCVAVKLVCVL